MRTQKDFRQESPEVWKRFKKSHKEFKKTDYATFRNIVQEFNMLLRDYMLETGEPVSLPCGHGQVKIIRYKPKPTKKLTTKEGKEVEICNYHIDWKATREYGKKIYHLNEHSDGYNYKIVWKHQTAKMKFASIWSFKPYRDFSRLINHYIKKGYKNVYSPDKKHRKIN